MHELDREDKPLRKAVFPDFGVVGELPSTDKGTFLLGAKLNEFAEVSLDGEIQRRITIAGSKPCYMTLPLSDNHTLVSCGYGGFLAEVDEKGAQLIEYDKSGNIVWTYHDIERIPGTLHGVQMLSKPLTNEAADK